MDEYVITNGELYHFGVKGMKWGVRRSKTGYRSTGLKAARARRANDKVDASFKDWQDNAKKKTNAIELGKKATSAKLAYESDKSNGDLKSAYKQANREYKKALGENTTYRKGAVRQEVGRDRARKYLSEAKAVKKQLTADPSNKELQKKYNRLMSEYDIERASARRAAEVGSKRSQKKAAIKRTCTMTVKTAATAAAVSAGIYGVNRYLNNHNVTLNGKRVNIGSSTVSGLASLIKKGKNAFGYVY